MKNISITNITNLNYAKIPSGINNAQDVFIQICDNYNYYTNNFNFYLILFYIACFVSVFLLILKHKKIIELLKSIRRICIMSIVLRTVIISYMEFQKYANDFEKFIFNISTYFLAFIGIFLIIKDLIFYWKKIKELEIK